MKILKELEEIKIVIVIMGVNLGKEKEQDLHYVQKIIVGIILSIPLMMEGLL